MYQPFLTEKATFLAEHGHLPEQERLRLWTRYNRWLDEHGLDVQTDVSGKWLDVSPDGGRRLSVPGIQTSYPVNCRLSRSAPPSFCTPRTNFFETGTVYPEELSLPVEHHSEDDISVSAYEVVNNTDLCAASIPPASAQPAVVYGDDLHSPSDTTTSGCFGPNGSDYQLTNLEPSLQPQSVVFTTDPPGHQNGLVDMLWSETLTATTQSCENTLGSAVSNEMSHASGAHSGMSYSGGIVSQSFGSTFPQFANFHNADLITDEAASYVTTSFQCTPSIYVNGRAADEVDESLFDYTCFDLSPEDNHMLSSPSFSTSPTTVYPSISLDSPVKCDSISNKNASLVDGESPVRTPRQEQNVGLRPLASKATGINGPTSLSNESKAQTMYEPPANKRKVSAFKSSYSRPKHPKKLCHLCDAYPDGFRGDHELRRHIDRAHMPVRKMFICVDNSPDGKFLEHCKKCKTKKRYGAYYNAAAHLRRTHFNKRQRGRGRGKTAERRAGAGGGDVPSMEVLKDWIAPVEDVNPHAGNIETSDSSSEDEMTPPPMLSTNQYGAYSSFDSDDANYSCSSYPMPEQRDSASYVRSEGDAYSHNASINSVKTPHTITNLKPKIHRRPHSISRFVPAQISSCPNSLDPSFFPPLHRPN